MGRSRVLFVFGTRPEAIKLAPVIETLRADVHFDVRVCVTGQHREMLEPVLRLFGIVPDADLDVMRSGQELAGVAAAVLTGVAGLLRELEPDVVVVQGDTTSAAAAAMAAFYAGVEVAHVEAGLRTGDLSAPFPEEANRRIISVVAAHHFAPTEDARAHLLREGVDASRVHVTGNTVIDALQRVAARIDTAALDRELAFVDPRARLILVTGHRRESFGEAFEAICRALADIAGAHEDVAIVYPVHLNPNVREPVHRILGDVPRVHLIEPTDYAMFVHLMRRSTFILTDSGGVQEEAPSLGKAVLVMRDTTERREAVRAGNVRLVGRTRASIVAAANELLHDERKLAEMSRIHDVFGDGHAAERIAALLKG